MSKLISDKKIPIKLSLKVHYKNSMLLFLLQHFNDRATGERMAPEVHWGGIGLVVA